MNEDEQVRLYVEMWKKTIEVQQHFNDIELRVRQLALTVLTFVLGGASLALRDGTRVQLFGGSLPLGSLILLSGVVLWIAFGFVDGIWYHRLLIGAVKHGQELETEIGKALPLAGLTKQISASSPSTIAIGKLRKQIHSGKKLLLFYSVISAVLVASFFVTL